MNPETFLAQDDVPLLVQALVAFAFEIDAAVERKEALVNAGIHFAFRSKLTYATSPQGFANQLVAHFREYRASNQQPAYHPMISFLDYLLKTRELEDRDRELFNRLVRRGLENFDGLTSLSAVGRIEAPPGMAVGTGVLVGRQLLLTCKHVFERIFEQGLDHAWVRFGYKVGKYGIEMGDLFEVDVRDVPRHHAQPGLTPDYALVRIIGRPQYHTVLLFNGPLNTTQSVRLVHHPRGEPAQISDVGQIVQAHKDHIKHNIKVDYGSSGAPIFDQSWRVVAIHRGALRPGRSPVPGLTEGLPLYSIWDDIRMFGQRGVAFPLCWFALF